MSKPDALELQGKPSRPEIIAGFIRSHRITIKPVNGGEQGVDQYHFLQHPQGSEPVTIGIVSFDRESGAVLPVDLKEMSTRLAVPGFVRKVTHPFAGLLISTNGDYDHAEEFDPIADASGGVPDGTRAQARAWRFGAGWGTPGISEQ